MSAGDAGVRARGRLYRLSFALACALVLGLPAHAGPTGEPEPELRSRLAQAIRDGDGFDDRYAAEVWLTDMSTRMKRHVPRAMPDAARRLEFLRLVHAEAARARVSPELVMAVINVESGFDRLAGGAGLDGEDHQPANERK